MKPEEHDFAAPPPRDIKLAVDHVDWLLDTLTRISRVVGIEEFRHGYRHGWEDCEAARKEADLANSNPDLIVKK